MSLNRKCPLTNLIEFKGGCGNTGPGGAQNAIIKRQWALSATFPQKMMHPILKNCDPMEAHLAMGKWDLH